MWKRWGTPPDLDGKFTSGFHEEFERSIKRRKRNEKPEISLFFKALDEEFMVDPGPDLLKVLKFKNKIISEKSILFQTFSTIREIEELIRKCVSHYVVRIKKDELSESPNHFEKQTKAQTIARSPDRSGASRLDLK